MDHREESSAGSDRPADAGMTAVVDPVTEPFAAVRPDPASAASAGVEPRADAGLGTWTFTDAMVGLGAVLLASAVISAGVQIAVDSGLPRGPWLPLFGLLPVWIGLLGTTVWACRRHGSGSLVTDLGLRVRWSDLAVGVGMAIAGRIVAALIAVLVVGVTRQPAESNLQDLVGPGLGQTGWLIVYTVAIAVVGPIIEEVFFRGLALRSALASLSRSQRPRFATPAARQRFAALLTAGLFAALHLPEVQSLTMLLILMPSLFFFGWMVARWTMWSGRLGGAIVAHIGFNAVAAGVLLWSGLGR
ncbi:CPBP family intramembrane glutamic endopeptidase [Nakamurella flava]|uniref:CPBP family intramembrane glutamic endopeptidase n=1 Tax=Nakamurella flava TaxID=2576308 RepID=UPI0014094A71|nr:CPBP family intramembrane glutamic endopeptidase [Nakamurella flava]